MLKLSTIAKICFTLTVLFPESWLRKYDVNLEAMRLYGEDLPSVLRKFRRSPEYLQLLQEKYNLILLQLEEALSNTMIHVCEDRIPARLEAILEKPNEETTPTIVYYKSFQARRAGEEENLANATTTISPIEMLENYSSLKSTLTVKERNRVRDIAFEETGVVFHMTIRGLGPLEIKSTRQPFGGEDIRSTTERDHRHLISTKIQQEYADYLRQNQKPTESPLRDDALRSFKLNKP